MSHSKLVADNGIEYRFFTQSKSGEEDDYMQYLVYALNAPEYGCKYNKKNKDSTCAVVIVAGNFYKAQAPGISRDKGERVWAMNYAGIYNDTSRVTFVMEDAQLPTIELHQRISEGLPKWAFMFQPDAANYLMVNKDGGVKGYPYWLNQGKELHFVTPIPAQAKAQ